VTSGVPRGDLDTDRVLAELARRFPGVCAWLGVHTGAWWAVTRDAYGRDLLVEARTPAELCGRLESMRGRAVPRARPARSVRPASGSVLWLVDTS
jgi:hypothetical protein